MSNSRLCRMVLTGALALGLLAFVGQTADAQSRGSGCDDEAADVDDGTKKNYRTIRGADGKKIFVIEKAFVVCGKVPKPTVIYVLQASSINYEWETLKQDFLPKVLDSAKKEPF